MINGFHTLMYHEIIKREDWDAGNDSYIKVKQDYRDVLPKTLFVYLDEFEKQMEYLYQNNYRTLKLQEIIDFYYKGINVPEKSVLLTFDDMYRSLPVYAYPVLKKYGFHAAGFVVLDWLFDEPGIYSPSIAACLSKDELAGLSDVFEYANHTKALHTRKEGLTALQTADREMFMNDIMECEEFTGSKRVFAYPFGIAADNIVEWLKEAGFLLAFTTKPGCSDKNTNPLLLNRDGIFLNDNLKTFIGKLEV